jgi:hypothetical protein
MTGSGSQSDLELRGLSFESVPGDNPLPDQAGQEDDHELEEKDIHLPPRLPQSGIPSAKPAGNKRKPFGKDRVKFGERKPDEPPHHRGRSSAGQHQTTNLGSGVRISSGAPVSSNNLALAR